MSYYRYARRTRRSKESRSAPIIILGIAGLIVALLAVLLLTISRVSQPSADTLVVGTSTGFPPFEMRFGEEIRGFDIDLCGKVADALGRKMLIRDVAFDALLPSLGRGSAGEKPLVDMVCAGVTKTSGRDEIADFSSTYFVANQAILTTKERDIRYVSPEDLEGLFVAYQEGSTSQSWFKDNVLGKIAVSGQEPFTEMVIALQRLGKDFDAIIIDEPAARSLLKSRNHLEIAGVIETGEEYGFAVANGDPQKILHTTNQVLELMRENGEYDKILERWFVGNEKSK